MQGNPSRCVNCNGEWFTMHEGKMCVPHQTPFHPEASAQVVCVPCFDKLSVDRVIDHVLNIVRETTAYKAMPMLEQMYVIMDVQQMVESLKGTRKDPPFNEHTPVLRGSASV